MDNDFLELLELKLSTLKLQVENIELYIQKRKIQREIIELKAYSYSIKYTINDFQFTLFLN